MLTTTDIVQLVIVTLAAGRVTYLLVHDEIARPLREWIWLRSAPESSTIREIGPSGDTERPARMYHPVDVPYYDGDGELDGFKVEHHFEPTLDLRAPGFFGKLIECPYCTSFWVSAAATIAWVFAPEITMALALPIAVWCLANIVAAKIL